MRERDTSVLRLGFRPETDAGRQRFRCRPVAGYDSATRLAGTAPRSSVLRACHCAASSSSARNLISPPASSATGMPSRYRTRLPVSARASGRGSGCRRGSAGRRRTATRRVGVRLAPDLAQHPDRLRQRELLARKPGDEAAAADLAARFEPAIDAQQVAPRRQPCAPRVRAAARTRRRSGAATCARGARRRHRRFRISGEPGGRGAPGPSGRNPPSRTAPGRAAGARACRPASATRAARRNCPS